MILRVAAGGGGDAIAAVLRARMSGVADDDLVIATWAWDRLMIDPKPGPRGAAEFEELSIPAPNVHLLTATSRPRAPAGSSLPRLARELNASFVLLDPTSGTRSIARQLAAAASWLEATEIEVVDVGGDALGRPGDPGLRTPLADITTLVASYLSEMPTRLVVLGPGLDGELSPTLVQQRLLECGAVRGPDITRSDVEALYPVLEWHPSEATALLVAAASGHRGSVLIRDGRSSVEIRNSSSAQWFVNKTDLALPSRSILETVGAAGSLQQLESVFRRLFGTDEIGFESRKQREIYRQPFSPRSHESIQLLIENFLQEAGEQGATWVTRRCLEELVIREGGLRPEIPILIERRWSPPLVVTRPRCSWPRDQE